MIELLTDAQLVEREAAWNTNGRGDPAKFAQFACEQEPALLARLREAERIMILGANGDPAADAAFIAYFAQVRSPLAGRL